MGRWRKEVSVLCVCDVWWQVIRLSVTMYGPVQHIHNYFAQKHKSRTSFNKVAELMFFKGTMIMSEFGELFKTPTWASHIVKYAVPEWHEELILLGVELNCCHYSGFWRRLLQSINQRPLTIMKFAYQPSDVDCEMRRALATELLETELNNLDVNSRIPLINFIAGTLK